jgi:hypothetical protein
VKTFFCTAALIGSLVALPAIAAPIVIQPPAPAYDKEVFEAVVRDAMDFPMSRGFSAVVIRNGQFVQEVSGGLAQEHANSASNVAFTMDTPTNIGSAVKVLSFVATLRAFEDAPQGKSVQQWLDSPIVPHLPAAWRNHVNAQNGAAHQQLRKVTFRQLMQHRSGWGEKPGPTMFDRMVAGVTPAQFGTRQYQNVNATIITYLLPRIVDPAWAAATDQAAVNQNIAPGNAQWYGQRYGARFETIMQGMFNAVLPTSIQPSCDPAVDYPAMGRKFAYSYATPFGGTGTWYSEKLTNGGCHAQGGYYLSMRELAMFWATFQATDNILQDSTKALMYNDAVDPWSLNQLGWARIVNSPSIKENFGVNGNPSHNGAHLAYKAAMVKLPLGYMAFIATNQTSTNTASNLEDLMKNAFVQAMAANFE